MRKIHRAVQTGLNKWEKKTHYEFDEGEIITVVFCLIIAAAVVVRAVIG